mgnify:CR=1 FL=1
MKDFEVLFGIPWQEVKKTCILMPFVPKDVLRGLGIRRFVRGKLYGAGNGRNFTIIHTGMGPALNGDAVLYLAEAGCKNLILFGSCGLLAENNGLGIGSLVSPSKAYSLESFSRMLANQDIASDVYYPDKKLLEDWTSAAGSSIKQITCATVSSLKLEEERRGGWLKQGIEAVDMECSAFFAAASHSGLKAIAVFYVTDIIGVKPFYQEMGLKDKAKISLARKMAAGLLCKFIQENLLA